ncbi:MAG: ATP-binding cassette domain-containing protein [Acidimicrobiales bacterium]
MIAPTPRFELRDVRVDGDEGPIVDGFSASVPPEGLTVVMGPSGAGKTTLLRLLNRLDDPDAGTVLLDGRDVRTYDVLELRRRVQSVGQVPVTFPGTVADNVGPDVVALLAHVGLDPALATRDADRLSVGEAQRMALARSLALGPDVLCLDEPTSALDATSKGGIEELVRHLADEGLTVVMVTHDPRHADLADHVIEVQPLRAKATRRVDEDAPPSEGDGLLPGGAR